MNDQIRQRIERESWHMGQYIGCPKHTLRKFIDEYDAIRARAAELEQALRVHVTVAPNDPLLVTPLEQDVVALRAQLAQAHAHLEAQRQETYRAVEREQAAKQQLAAAQAEIARLKGEQS